MMATSHMIFGATCWTAVCITRSTVPGIEIIVATFAALLPDIDHPHSKLGRLIPFVSYPLTWIIGHRGLTHSLLAVLAMIYLMIWGSTDQLMIEAVAVGYLSHLIGDWLTGGIPLFWPYKKKYASPITFRTNSFVEPMVVAMMLTGLLYYAGFDTNWFYDQINRIS